MTAKKVIPKTKTKSDKKEVKSVVKTEYKPIFNIPIVEKKIVKRDLNYYGIKQYLKNKMGVDLFRKLRDDIADKKLKTVVEKKDKQSLKDYFHYLYIEKYSLEPIEKYYEDMNACILEYWDKYCVWWYAHVGR